MKNPCFASALLFGFAALLFPAAPAHASDVNVTPAMQACSSDADCTLADGQCGNTCSSVPINTRYTSAFEQKKVATCGQSSGAEPACRTMPALTASCIHSRCTIGTAYQEHADAKDYGAENLRKSALKYNAIPASQPENIAPAAGDAAPGQPQYGARKNGFTAYDMPDHGMGTVHSLGTVTAPASGQ
jgi:hypothetical protein